MNNKNSEPNPKEVLNVAENEGGSLFHPTGEKTVIPQKL